MELDKRILQTEELKTHLNLRLARDCLKQLLLEEKNTGLLWLEHETVHTPFPLILMWLSMDTMLWIERIDAVPATAKPLEIPQKTFDISLSV